MPPPEEVPKKPRVKRKKVEQHAAGDDAASADATQVAVAGSATEAPPRKKSKKTKKKHSKGPLTPSTPGNLEEAMAMRERLGIKAADPASASKQVGFSFGFAVSAAAGNQSPWAETLDGSHDDGAAVLRVSDGGGASSPTGGAKSKANRSTPPEASAGKHTPGGGRRVRNKHAAPESAQHTSSDSSDSDASVRSNAEDARPAAAHDVARQSARQAQQDPAQVDARAVPAEALQAARAEAPDAGMEAAPGDGRVPSAAAQQGAKPPDTFDVDADGFVPRRIYAGGMPFWYSEAEIRECWETCGPIEHLSLLTFPDSGNFRGIAFITFETQAAFEAALAFHGEDLDGKTLVVKRCRAPAPRAPPRADDASKPGGARGGHTADRGKRTVAGAGASKAVPTLEKPKHAAPPGRVDGYNVAFVGNIPWEMNKQAIEDLFSSLRPSLVRMFDDPATGRHRGFAHLHFSDAAGVDKALKMDGEALMGRTLKVMYAQPSKRKEAPKGANAHTGKRRKPTKSATTVAPNEGGADEDPLEA